MKRIKTYRVHRGVTQTAIVLVAAVLSSCGGGGGSSGGSGSGISPAAFSQERDFSRALAPINAAAAYERGYTGEGSVVHLIDANVFADDKRIDTNVSKQFEISEGDFHEVKQTKAKPNCDAQESYCIDRSMEEDTVKAQLIAEPMNGRDGLGVAYDARIWAYRGSQPESIRRAAERPGSDIIQLPANLVGSEAALDALRFAVSQGDLMTKPAGSSVGSQRTEETLQTYSDFIDNLILIGSVNDQMDIASSSAGAMAGHFLVAPNTSEIKMWDRKAYNKEITVCVSPLHKHSY